VSFSPPVFVDLLIVVRDYLIMDEFCLFRFGSSKAEFEVEFKSKVEL
jgi:hypothetical protein